ncbi:MAG: tail fiber domain-containing protein [Acidobacteria bacterium]|nr:tail fiber domain-containing protein [Acidobacteriota bacterium]
MTITTVGTAMRRLAGTVCMTVALTCVVAPAASAQSLGTFSWQLAPFCNVITVQVTQQGSTYTLDGYDTQCGAATRATATGMAVLNPSGSVQIGVAIVTSPGAAPVHVDATIDFASLGGPWTDSLGHTGSFVYTPGGVGTGSPRPLSAVALPDGSVTSAKIADGTITATDVDPTSVQRRIAAACPTDELMTGVNADGTVSCQSVTSTSGGDITGVGAGFGLSGGGASGNVTLAVNPTQVQARINASCLAGRVVTGVAVDGTPTCIEVTNTSMLTVSGAVTANSVSAATVIANEYHSTGNGRMLGKYGQNNAYFGTLAGSLQEGIQNTFLGDSAGQLNEGSENVYVGFFAGRNATGVSRSTAVGTLSLDSLENGVENTAIGATALSSVGSGNRNIALGFGAGAALTSGDDNIYIGRGGAVSGSENATIRVGGPAQQRLFAAGVRGVTTGAANAIAVMIDSNGQLGTVSSSRRTKDDIHDLGGVGIKVQQLRPVRFRYIQPFADGGRPVQYGLIAEEVAGVLPELVVYDDEGRPSTVAYHVLPTLLLEEVQRLERERAALTAQLEQDRATFERRLTELETMLRSALREQQR